VLSPLPVVSRAVSCSETVGGATVTQARAPLARRESYSVQNKYYIPARDAQFNKRYYHMFLDLQLSLFLFHTCFTCGAAVLVDLSGVCVSNKLRAHAYTTTAVHALLLCTSTISVKPYRE
jgi:hypothetical protein